MTKKRCKILSADFKGEERNKILLILFHVTIFNYTPTCPSQDIQRVETTTKRKLFHGVGVYGVTPTTALYE
ncbi:hypothetical protein V6Z12_A04G121900 [Gossypium hirsutum]